MGQNIGRTGRRRRVMKEELLSASFAAYDSSQGSREIEPGDTPRYGAGANIENHPQVTDFVPRRYRLIGLVAVLGLAVGVASELASYFAGSLSAWTQVLHTEEIRAMLSDRLVAWTSAAMLLATACYARLIYSLRRHRVDDYRGRYRVWRIAVVMAVALSINAILGLHEPVSRVLAHLTGWSLLPGHVGWWLLPAAIVGGWLLVKLTWDARECRTAALTYRLALVCFAAAAADSLGWSPTWLVDFPGILGRSLPAAANLLLLTGTLLYARYVVLDVQGLIEHPATPSKQSTNKTNGADPVSLEQAAEIKQGADSAATAEPPQSNNWVDGSEPENDDDSLASSRLSKAERKRLRKQKSEKWAA